MRHLGIFANGMRLEGAPLCRNSVYMHRSVTALSSNVLVQGIPCDALHIMGMFRDLVDAFP